MRNYTTYGIMLSLFCLVLFLTGCQRSGYGVKIPSSDNSEFPENAKEISFVNTAYFSLVFECTVDEEDVRKRWPDLPDKTSEITTPVTAIACDYEKYKNAVLSGEKVASQDCEIGVKVRNGTYYSKQFSNGGHILIVYDRNSKKLYYSRQSR